MHLRENFLCDIEPYLGLENVKCRSPFGCNKRSFSKVISVSSYLSIFAFQLKVIVLFTYTHFSHNCYIFIPRCQVKGKFWSKRASVTTLFSTFGYGHNLYIFSPRNSWDQIYDFFLILIVLDTKLNC